MVIFQFAMWVITRGYQRWNMFPDAHGDMVLVGICSCMFLSPAAGDIHVGIHIPAPWWIHLWTIQLQHITPYCGWLRNPAPVGKCGKLELWNTVKNGIVRRCCPSTNWCRISQLSTIGLSLTGMEASQRRWPRGTLACAACSLGAGRRWSWILVISMWFW